MAEKKIISLYEVRYDCQAPKIALAPKEPQSFKTLKGGTTVQGYVMEVQPGLSALVTEDNLYAVPLTALSKKRDISIDGKPVELSPEEAARLTELPKSIQDKIDAITQTDMINKVITNAQKSSTGLVVGAVLGIAFGLFFKKNVTISAIVGAVSIGFLATKVKLPSLQTSTQ